MERYICENVFIPLRSGPSHRSEMLSQILFGERYTIQDKAGTWVKIESQFDKFTGWVDYNHLQTTVDEDNKQSFILNKALPCFKNDKTKLVLEPGCEIFDPDFENNKFYTGNNVYTANKDFDRNYVSVKETVTDTAMKFVNSPYIWGGRIPSGIDCSGFTQLVYKIHGRTLPRNSSNQINEGTIIDFIDEAVPGDLVFFDNERGNITHVGMIISKGLVIHASGLVRIDTIDHQGIFKKETGAYSHHLRMIKRIL
jgi:cell wall-associated NlpC family hydrolase